MNQATKLDILQSLLDVQKLAGEWFDAIEADRLVVDKAILGRLGALVKSLAAVHENLLTEYVLSGRASDEMMAEVRASLGYRRESASKSQGGWR